MELNGSQEHHEIVDVTSTTRPHVLLVVANPSTASTHRVARRVLGG